MTELIVLLHAPVLGPGSWAPVRDELTAAGRAVVVPSLTGFTAGGPPYGPRLAGLCAGQIAGQIAAAGGTGADRVVLVAHSGAGAFVPQVAGTLGAGRVDAVFADAGLPAAGPTPVVDGAFLPYLRQIARDGLVPPWPEWFPQEDPAQVFPTERARAAVASEARAIPLAFFEEELPGGRAPQAAGYLLFSPGYRAEADEARRRGWPVTELPGSHLHPLVDPAGVAAALTELIGRLSW
jgi:hypothetical protein